LLPQHLTVPDDKSAHVETPRHYYRNRRVRRVQGQEEEREEE
jgi:hypothetical protein